MQMAKSGTGQQAPSIGTCPRCGEIRQKLWRNISKTCVIHSLVRRDAGGCRPQGPLDRQAILLRQRLQRDLRPRANVLDDFGGSERAQPPGILVAKAARKAKQEACREQIASAGGIDQSLDREGRYGLDLFLRGDDASVLASRDRREANVAAQLLQRGVEVRRLIQR